MSFNRSRSVVDRLRRGIIRREPLYIKREKKSMSSQNDKKKQTKYPRTVKGSRSGRWTSTSNSIKGFVS